MATIAQIRNTIDACNWVRKDVTGGTQDEFKRCDVPAHIAPHIAAVKALVIPARFQREIEGQAWAVECGERVIARWKAVQPLAA